MALPSYMEIELGFPDLASTLKAPKFKGKSQVGPHACRQYTHQESPLVNPCRLSE